ncbi:MAG: hypothetical protein Q7R35_07265 [Elusimicrobiota bacterium]|nr:hypothetical protein [Elusimicrobiota bacterium]
MLLGIIIYCTVFALVYAGALVWILERKEKEYRQGSISFTDAFIVGASVVIFVYLTNIVVLMSWPRAAATAYDIVLVTALAAFGVYRETAYKARAWKTRRRLRAETRLLEWHVAKDPANAAYYERLSEVYEILGEKEKALVAARMAAKLDPAVKNTWRVKQLEEL